jgi:hypothetical protein
MRPGVTYRISDGKLYFYTNTLASYSMCSLPSIPRCNAAMPTTGIALHLVHTSISCMSQIISAPHEFLKQLGLLNKVTFVEVNGVITPARIVQLASKVQRL